MASSDLRRFLEDALLRYDPDIDLSEGSRANAELVEPIIERIGIDPFDQDVATFVQSRVRQAFPDLAITEVDELTDVLIDPMRVLLEPVIRETKLVKLRRSLRNVDSMSDDEVDALMGNFFANRIGGGFAVGVVRLYFSTPQSITLSAVNPATTRSGLRFLPTRPQQITADQMLLNIEGSEYYFDANYTAERRGDEYNVEPREIVSIANVPTAVRVRNPRRFRFGAPRETNNEFVARVERSLGDKTLNTDRGIVAVLPESFPAIRRIFSVGFRDPEMQRDVVKGAGLGPIPSPDVDGNFFGAGTAPDDLDANTTTRIVDAPSGSFVSRLGAVGTVPAEWFVTLVYTDTTPALRVVDAAVLEVLSNTQIRVDHDLPVTSPATSLTWMLRRRGITLSDIPGGITLPDSTAGTLELPNDTIHIGGKTDIYLAGETETATAQIEGLTDQNPLARGNNALTQGSTPGLEDTVELSGYVPGDRAPEPGMSLVLEEGVDAGSYRIIAITSTSPYTVRLATAMTGAQGGLSWRVVDEIDVELTDPKAIKLTGSDLITVADSGVVTTAGAVNFIDANVVAGDVLEVLDDEYGGEYTVTEVNAVSLVVEPVLVRTLGSVAYRIFRRSEGVDTPVVRITSMELLDSSGAPSGTQIPFRDPVAVVSNAFQNEGTGVRFDGRVITGLVTRSVVPTVGTYAVGTLDFFWEVLDPTAVWAAVPSPSVFTFTPGVKTAAQVAAEINGDAPLVAAGVRALVITKDGREYVGIVSARHVRISGGSALAELGWVIGSSNARLVAAGTDFSQFAVRIGDVVEVVDGTNAGTRGRVIFGPTTGSAFDEVIVGRGPVGPEDTTGQTSLYDNVVFNPDVSARVRIGRPSVGSARAYFLAPTSAEFRYGSTRLTARQGSSELSYVPDPENQRVVVPAPPLTELTHQGTSSAPDSLNDTTVNFLLQGVKPGDLLELLYIPITGTAPLSSVGNIAVGGLSMRIRLGTDPFITITFPFDMPRQDVVDYINEQVGETVASLDLSGALQLQANRPILLDDTPPNALGTLSILSLSNEHPDSGIYIIRSVAENTLTLSTRTPGLVGVSQPLSAYRVLRYVQRVSSTEMNENQDATGLYYADVQMVSEGPGDVYNLNTGVEMEITGHAADGFRLSTENPVLSYSRAEVLFAEISRSILLVGSSDSPEEYVQLSQQNVQVTYDRSQLVDEVQSFCDSDLHRVLNEEILVRHLFPHYVSLTWNYLGGSAEAVMRRAFETLLDEIEPNEALEVTDLTSVLTKRGASSVYVTDTASLTGRAAPLFVVVYHDESRRIRAQIVRDFVTTVRTQRYIPDNIRVLRVSAGTLR
jgi:hypothetical protein